MEAKWRYIMHSSLLAIADSTSKSVQQCLCSHACCLVWASRPPYLKGPQRKTRIDTSRTTETHYRCAVPLKPIGHYHIKFQTSNQVDFAFKIGTTEKLTETEEIRASLQNCILPLSNYISTGMNIHLFTSFIDVLGS